MLQFLSYPAQTQDTERAKLLWLFRLRWIAITLFFVLAAPALSSGLLARTTMGHYLGVVGILGVFNLFSQLALGTIRAPISPLWICFQLTVDVIFLTILLSLTGGFENPFVALFFLNVSLGGLLISTRLGWPFLLLSHTLLGILEFRFFTSQPPGSGLELLTTFAVYQVLLLAFWLVMRSLGSHIEAQSQHRSQVLVGLERKDRLRAIGALAAGFSHEFASPLTTARIRLERLARGQNSEDVAEALAAVQACETVVHRMNASQLDNRESQLKRVPVGALLGDIIESWQAEHPDCPVSLSITDPSDDLLPPVNFAQVILNLLDNARDAAPSLPIEVVLQGSEHLFQLRVSDQGPGFPQWVLDHMGEPFVTSKSHGTGLGLYVTQLFCHSLGGTMTIENHVKVRESQRRGADITLEWPKGGGLA